MGHHQQQEFSSLRVKVITVSDSRDLDSDKSGALICEKLVAAGHIITSREVVVDTIDNIRHALNHAISDEQAQAIILNGGTGVTPRDQTPEAIEPLFDKHLPGFGELFRHLSFSEIGAATIQSRATAGMINGAVVFSLPGSTNACRLALDAIILPQLDARTKPCSFSALLGL
ncbi:MAG: molybdopterin-binding protein [Planctomycetota bacterium]|jgi:molybdenum cofactor biosynthesis protein B|nr:molybdenum cofactor biosynthesis protein [Planctomycetota bacterium]MDG1405489.1 molybdopterin-binding protein [Planctomycetota bacterium]